jgi:hypothetical protein
MAQVPGLIVDYFHSVDGVDTISSSVALGPSKFRDAQNINMFPVGGYSWRNGYVELNTSAVSASACNGLSMPRFTNGNVAVLVAGTKLYTMPSNLNGTWTDKTNGVTLSAGNTVTYSFAVLNDIMVGCNDTDTTIQMDNALTVAVFGWVALPLRRPCSALSISAICSTAKPLNRPPGNTTDSVSRISTPLTASLP